MSEEGEESAEDQEELEEYATRPPTVAGTDEGSAMGDPDGVAEEIHPAGDDDADDVDQDGDENEGQGQDDDDDEDQSVGHGK